MAPGQSLALVVLQKHIIHRRCSAKFLVLGAIDNQQRSTVTVAFAAQFYVHHAAGIAVGIRVEQNAVHDAEDGRRSANSQREREHGGGRKAG